MSTVAIRPLVFTTAGQCKWEQGLTGHERMEIGIATGKSFQRVLNR